MEPARLHQDLVEWGVLEHGDPIRFTRRFQGALARAAASLSAADEAPGGVPGDPVQNQVDAALGSFLEGKGKECGLGHRRFVRAVHVAALPEAVRKLLGV